MQNVGLVSTKLQSRKEDSISMDIWKLGFLCQFSAWFGRKETTSIAQNSFLDIIGFLLNSTVEKAVVDGAQNHLLVPGRRPEPLDLHSTAYTYHLLEFKCVDIIYCPLSAPPSVSYFLYNCGNRNTLECKVWFFIDILSIKSTKSILQSTRSTI